MADAFAELLASSDRSPTPYHAAPDGGFLSVGVHTDSPDPRRFDAS